MNKQMAVQGVGIKRKKQKMVVHGDTPFLSDEIITNILKRLPVKSLIRFQCVCKHWKNLVKSASFIADHRHHPSNNQNLSLVFKQRGADPLNLFVVDCEMRALDVQKPPFMSNSCRASIVGTCNGLICVRFPSYASLGTSLFLWNPATREVRRVPGVIDDVDDGLFYFGFGFSPIVNDYKIVKIFTYHFVIKRVEVYSLNTDSWSEIEFGNIKGVQIFFPNASVNGSIFWCVWKKGVERDGIVSFDAAMEVFTLMPVPVLDINPRAFKVIVHDKKLFLLCRTRVVERYESKFDFWVMEEVVDAPGKKWSWTKIDNSSPYLSYLSTKISTICGRCGDYVFSYVESLVPIVSRHSEEPRS